MAGTVAWRSPLRAWMRWKWRALDGIPHPTDRPVASVAGVPSIECLALGSGPITGWGVASHQLGLVGALARSLARRFGHGVVVRATIDASFTVRDMMRVAPEQPWETAQIGVLSFGPNEVLSTARVRDWSRDLHELIDAVRDRMPGDSVLAVLGVPPLEMLSFLRGIGAPHLAALIVRYNAAARSVCEGFSGVRFVPLPVLRAHPGIEYRTTADYAAWGEFIAGVVVHDPAQVRPRPADESERAAAVERLGLLDSPPDERFDRIVRLAKSIYRTRSASFTVLHGDRQWHKARVGVRPVEIPRDQSLCDIAIQQGAPLVVGDAWADERFAESGFVQEAGVRFYAGYPLRAPDGHYVGALCVFDSEPRDPDDVDLTVLHELALMVEAELEADAAD